MTESKGMYVDWWRQGRHRPSRALIDWLLPIMRKVYYGTEGLYSPRNWKGESVLQTILVLHMGGWFVLPDFCFVKFVLFCFALSFLLSAQMTCPFCENLNCTCIWMFQQSKCEAKSICTVSVGSIQEVQELAFSYLSIRMVLSAMSSHSNP